MKIISKQLKLPREDVLMNFFFLTGLSPILFALTVDSEELNIVRQVCIS